MIAIIFILVVAAFVGAIFFSGLQVIADIIGALDASTFVCLVIAAVSLVLLL